MTIREYTESRLQKKMSAHDMVRRSLDMIEQKDSAVHAFLEVFADDALRQARAIDDAHDMRGILSGVPIAVKDNILVKGKRMTAGSKVLENYRAAYDATVIRRLKEQGAIIIGKTNLDEFAMGSSTEHSAFGPTRNPHDLDRVPGGSSGGSAAAVAADMAMVALGSDTGGSIRQPAAFCGVVGLKPTYGRVSRYGVTALASSLDQVGPFAQSVDDAALVLEAMSGHDPFDATSAKELFSYSDIDAVDAQSLRIGIPREYFVDGMSDVVKRAVEDTAKRFEQEGYSVSEVSLPHTRYALSVYYIIMPAEASANLARFDGIRYARLDSLRDRGISLQELYETQRGEGIGDEPTRRILLGTFALSAGYYDAYYAQAQKVRTLIQDDFIQAFNSVDVLLTPVTPTTAFLLGEKTDDPLSMYLSDIFTIPTNLAGLPALSLPTGATEGNLPINFQLIGNHFREADILSLGRWFEQLTAYHE